MMPRTLLHIVVALSAVSSCFAQALWDRALIPPADDQARMVFDSRAGREAYVVIVPTGNTMEVWEYPLARRAWELRTPPVQPKKRTEFTAAFDTARGVTVMFGGTAPSPANVTNAVWEWDGNTWEKRSPTGRGPSARKRCHAVYHGGLREIVIYAGTDTRTQLDDLWAYNGTSWRALPAGPTKPRPRNDAALAYDSNRNELLMFGGYVGNNGFDDKTWRWTAAGWQDLPVLTPPSPRGWHSLVYDPVRDRTLLLGQYLLWNNDETWEFDRAVLRWTRVSTRPPDGVRRENPSLCYDSVQKRVITFGGNCNYGTGFSDQYGSRSDLHYWNPTNASWVVEAAGLPNWANDYEMAFDPQRQAMVLVGFARNTPTWERIGGKWITKPHPKPTPFPRERDFLGIAYAGNGKTLLFGGRNLKNLSALAETWSWNGTSWGKLSPATRPPARMSHEMVTVGSAGSERVLLYGGEPKVFSLTPMDDMWRFDGTTWSQITRGSVWPPPLAHFAMAANAAGTEVLVFGGRTNGGTPSQQTWRYQVATSTWQLLLPRTNPPGTPYPEMTFDARLGDYVLTQSSGKVWMFNGTDWALRTKCERPRPVEQAAIAFDPTVGRVRAFGGYGYWPRSEEWLLDASGRARFESFGAGCSGGLGVPELRAPTPPRIGQNFTIQVQSPGVSQSSLAFGISSSQWGAVPLPLRLERDCWLQVSPDVLLSGGQSYVIPIPNDPSLTGICLVVQGLVTNAARAALTAPARLIFGL